MNRHAQNIWRPQQNKQNKSSTQINDALVSVWGSAAYALQPIHLVQDSTRGRASRHGRAGTGGGRVVLRPQKVVETIHRQRLLFDGGNTLGHVFVCSFALCWKQCFTWTNISKKKAAAGRCRDALERYGCGKSICVGGKSEQKKNNIGQQRTRKKWLDRRVARSGNQRTKWKNRVYKLSQIRVMFASAWLMIVVDYVVGGFWKRGCKGSLGGQGVAI